MGNCYLVHSVRSIINKVSGNQNRYKSSDEFDFGSLKTAFFRFTCPLMILFSTYKLEYHLDKFHNITIWSRLDQTFSVSDTPNRSLNHVLSTVFST